MHSHRCQFGFDTTHLILFCSAIHTLMKCQHPDGGFGGGPGQNGHLLPTYAAVCALCIVGGPGPDGGWEQIDRAKLYKWMMSLKQADGSFLVSKGGEVDVRYVSLSKYRTILVD